MIIVQIDTSMQLRYLYKNSLNFVPPQSKGCRFSGKDTVKEASANFASKFTKLGKWDTKKFPKELT